MSTTMYFPILTLTFTYTGSLIAGELKRMIRTIKQLLQVTFDRERCSRND